MSNIALAIDNHPGADPDDWFEIIEGVKTMNASARGNHNVIAGRIFTAFDIYFITHKITALAVPDVDVYLPDGNVFRPDLSVINELALIGEDGKIHGVPVLCVEVLSRSTAKNDVGIKKTIYAQNGVKEYWIIDPKNKSIEVYSLKNGSFELDEIYTSYTQNELNGLSDAERAEVKDKIQVGIYPDLIVDVNQIFRSLFN